MPPYAVPTPQMRHLLSRFSYGVTPALVGQARAAGGTSAWFEQQLDPVRIEDRAAATMRSWFPYLDKTAEQLFTEDRSGGRQGFEVTRDLHRWTLLRRVYSQRQVYETMVEFWSNLLHVPAPEPKCWPVRPAYDTVIRTHALGTFEAMLLACELHPAMGCYLDNAVSTADNVNENLGRELLELHTVGIDGGFTEEQVRDSAYILTGYQCDRGGTWRSTYSTADHWRGPVKVLGFSDANAAADGRPTSLHYLRYLAHHPATARRIARRLAVRFVSDNPSAGLVTAVADAYTRSGTDITTTLRALTAHPEFAASVGAKIKTPTEDGVATYRALGVRVSRPTGVESGASAIAFQVMTMGQMPFDWGRPDGFPDVAEAWTSATRMIGSWHAHWSLAGGYYPRTDTRYRPVSSWLPALPARFDTVVDHVARELTARPATPQMTEAATIFVGIPATTRIRLSDDISQFRMNKLLSVILDSPAHMSR
jgi:uncharacterized protein (DUF1800 family)